MSCPGILSQYKKEQSTQCFMHELDRLETSTPAVCQPIMRRFRSFAAAGSLKPKRCRSLMMAAAFSGTIRSHPGSPVWILFRTSREKISIMEASYPTIGGNVMIFQQMRVQVPQMHLDLEVECIDPYVGGEGM